MPTATEPSNSLVQKYRQFLASAGRKDFRNDWELTLELGDKLRARGDTATEEAHPDFARQYQEARKLAAGSTWEETKRAFSSGIDRTQAGLYGALAAGSEVIGRAFGTEGGGEFYLGKAAEQNREAEEARGRRSFDRVEETKGDSALQTIGNFLRYGFASVAENAPQLGGTVAAGAGGFLLGGPGGAALAAGATSIPLEVGTQYAELGTDKGVDPTKALTTSLTYGTAAGLVDAVGSMIPGGAIATKIGGKQIAKNVLAKKAITALIGKGGNLGQRAVRGFAMGVTGEGVTEAIQEAINIAGEEEARGEELSPEAYRSRLLNAGVAGGLLGGVVGGVIGAAPEAKVETTAEKEKREAEAKAKQTQGIGTSEAARRAAAAAITEPTPPRKLTRGEQVRAVRNLAPEAQDARIKVLEALAKRTAHEDEELEVLRAQVSQRPRTGPLPTPPPAPPVSVVGSTVIPTQTQGETHATEEGKESAIGLIKHPNAPQGGQVAETSGGDRPAQSGQVAKVAPAPSPLQLSARIQAVGRKLSALTRSAYTLDLAPAHARFTAIAQAGEVKPEDVLALEVTVLELEKKAVAESARLASEQATKAQKAAADKAAAKAKTIEVQAERAAKKLAKAEEAKARLLPPPPPSATVDTAPAPAGSVAPTGQAAPSVAAPSPAPPDNLEERLRAALNPPQPAAAPASAAPFAFGKVNADKSVPLRDAFLDAEGNLRPPTLEQLKAVDWEKKLDEIGATKDAQSDQSGLSNTRVALALLAPDGRVLVRGLLPAKETLRVGPGPQKEFAVGISVQRMGALKGRRKDKGKVIDPAKENADPVLLNDLIAAGYVPLNKLFFEGDPGVITEDFADVAAFDAAFDATEKMGGQGQGQAEAVAAAAAADVAQFANPEQLNALDEDKAREIIRRERAKQRKQPMRGDVFAQGDEAMAAADALAAKGDARQAARAAADEGGNTPHVPAEVGAESGRFGAGPWQVRVRSGIKGRFKVVESIAAGATEAAIQAAYDKARAGMTGGTVELRNAAGKSVVKLQVQRMPKAQEAETPPARPDIDVAGLIGEQRLRLLARKLAGQDAATVRKELVAFVTKNEVGRAYMEVVGSRKQGFDALLHAIATYEAKPESRPASKRGDQGAGADRGPGDTAAAGGGGVVGAELPGGTGAPAGGAGPALPGSAAGPAGGAGQRGGRPAGRAAGRAELISAPFTRISDRWLGKLHALIQQSGGRFEPSAEFEVFFSKFAGVERGVVLNYIQDAYNLSAGKAEVFAELLRGHDILKVRHRTESAASPPARAISMQLFNRMVQRLRATGMDVQIFEGELNEAIYATDGNVRHVTLVMQDLANANFTNLVALIHEQGHDLMAGLTTVTRARIIDAVDATIKEVRSTSPNANANPEEKLVETLGQKLAAELVDGAPSLAAEIIARIKRLYLRVGAAIFKALGREPNDAMVLAWFEQNLRRRFGMEYDARFIDLFQQLLPESTQARAGRFERVGGAPVPNFFNPLTGRIEQPVVADHTLDGWEWNMRHDADYTEATTRMSGAAWNEVLPVMEAVHKQVGGKLTLEQFFKVMGWKGDSVQKILDALESRVRGAAKARIGGENFTPAMDSKARGWARGHLLRLINSGRQASATRTEAANKAANALPGIAKKYNRLERDFRDADATNYHLTEVMKDLIRVLAGDLNAGPDLAFAAGELHQSIREAENLTADQLIPDEYQRVFKQMLDADSVTLFDHVSAMARLDLPWGRMPVNEIIQAVQDNAARDPQLASLAGRRPLMVGLAALAKHNGREMDLLQLRVMKDTAQFLAIKAELDEIRTASDEHLEKLRKTYKESLAAQGLRDRLRGEYLDARRKLRATERVIQKAENEVLMIDAAVGALEQKLTEVEAAGAGAFSEWHPHHGATYRAMQLREDGTWTSVERTLQMTGPEVTEQREQVLHDLRLNRLYLEGHAHQAESRLYEEVNRQTRELGFLDIARDYQAGHRTFLDKLLQPVADKFGATGKPAGLLIKQMLLRFQTIGRTEASKVETHARVWTKKMQKAAKAAGYKYWDDFFREIYTPVVYQLESEPGRDWANAMREGVRAARRRIPQNHTVAPDFAEKLGELMQATEAISTHLLGIAEKNGVFVEDARLKDTLGGKGNLKRHAVKYGVLTVSRRLRASAIQILAEDMQKAGWTDKTFAELDAESLDDDGFAEAVQTYFTPAIVRDFVEPFVNKPGREVFFGAKNGQGKGAHVSQLEAQQVWVEAKGDVAAFIDRLFVKTNQKDDESELPAFRKEMLRRFAALYQMESKLAAKTSQPKSPHNPDGPKPHRIMDGRTNDLLPPEHLDYDVFDVVNARQVLAEFAYHAAFGRNGQALDVAVNDLRADLDTDQKRFEALPHGSRKHKEEVAARHGWNFKAIERGTQNRNAVDAWMTELGRYFSVGNSTGMVPDAKALLEVMQVNMALVLNQPKSGLWNVLSTLDFPIAYKGVGPSSVRGTAYALRNLTNGIFGSLFEAFGLNLLRASAHTKEVGEWYEGRDTERLEFGTMMADVGKGGSFQEGGSQRVTQAARALQQASRKGFKADRAKGEFGTFNFLTAPFRYLSEKTSVAIAAANVQVFELMVQRGIEFFNTHPEAYQDPAFEFTAEHLAMNGPAFFSDEGAFKFFRDRAAEYRLGNLADIVRGAAERQSKREPLLTRDQTNGVAMMALDHISLDASINTRPIEFFNSQAGRFGGLLMGWPLARVNQVNQVLKTHEGQGLRIINPWRWKENGKAEILSTLRGLGVMAGWVLPLGLAYSLLMDEYDEHILGKAPNLRKIDPIAAVPLVGPVAALLGAGEKSGEANLLGIMERGARAGTYGLLGDAVASFASVIDPKSGQRDFDLNSRILIFSQFANLRDTVRNFIHQDMAYTYSSVGRPFLTTLGGNGVLQAHQIVNNALGLDNEEARYTRRVGVNNVLRAAGREAEVPLKMGGARVSPTPTSVWVREMQLAAMGNDRAAFLEAYRNGIAAARKQGDEDPEKTILAGWQRRHPFTSIFEHKPTEDELRRLNAAMDDNGRLAVREAVSLYDRFTDLIAPSPFQQMMQRQLTAQRRALQPPSIEQLRRQMAQSLGGY